MPDRKYSGTEPGDRRRQPSGYDPISNDLAVAFAIVIGIALFTMGRGSFLDLWSDFNGAIDQVLRTAGS